MLDVIVAALLVTHLPGTAGIRGPLAGPFLKDGTRTVGFALDAGGV